MTGQIVQLLIHYWKNYKSCLAESGLRATDRTVWLAHNAISGLFDTTRQTARLHLKNILEDRELLDDSVVKDSLTTASDEKQYPTNMHDPDAMLAVGFRVRAPRGTQFRRGTNTVLKEHRVQGFAMDDTRLKQSEKRDYFVGWLARIRDIRAPEKRFYPKVKDLYSTAVDYDRSSEPAQFFIL